MQPPENVKRRPGEGGIPNALHGVIATPNSTSRTGLTAYLSDQAKANGTTMGALTVQANQNDPFRVGTPAGRALGQWFADTYDERFGDRRLHLRDAFYGVVGEVTAPDGTVYTNSDKTWDHWQKAAKCARWNDLFDFTRLRDAKASEPILRRADPMQMEAYVSVGLDIEVPSPEDIQPTVGLAGVYPRQEFKLVMFGEKSGLDEALVPICDLRQADLYLGEGELGDTYIHLMAAEAVAEDRKLIVFTFVDSDPPGRQMQISIANKLAALRVGFFPKLEFRVVPVLLSPIQVGEYGLPYTIPKKGMAKQDEWFEQYGVHQTEINAMTSRNPDEVRRLTLDAIAPYYDTTLERRVRDAKREWLGVHQARLDDAISSGDRERIAADAAIRLAEMAEQIEQMQKALTVDTDIIDFDDFDVPQAVTSDKPEPPAIYDTDELFAVSAQKLIEIRAFEREAI